MTDAIVAEGLVKRYGSVVALDGLDLAVPEGTIMGLLGPNGAARRQRYVCSPPCSSRTRAPHGSVRKDADELRKRIGLSGQYAAVDDNLTGFENLDMVGRPHHLGRARSP